MLPDREVILPRTTERGSFRPSVDDDHQIAAWALAAGQGDPQALAAFVRSTQGDVWRFLHYLLDLPSADDLTQEVYRRVVRALPQSGGARSTRIWLLTVARRLAAEHAVAHVPPARPRQRPSSGDGPGYEKDLRRMMGQLRQERREAFVATQVLGLSYVEAAHVCDCPVPAIRSRVARARDDLAAIAAADRENGG